MLRKTFNFLLALSFLAGMLACSTELEVNAPYQEKKVIYCLLNPREPFQVARISKGFLNEGRSALDIAKNNRDSILYDTNDIVVELIQFYPNIALAEIKWILKPFTEYNKEDGVFYAPDQLLYKTENIKLDTVKILDVRYKLRVTNKLTNQVSEGKTELVGRNFRLFQPLPERGLPVYFDFFSRRSTTIKFNRPDNATITEGIFSWNIEVTKSNNEKSTEIWKMTSPGKMGDADNSIQISGAVSAGEFWRFLKQEVATRGNTDVISRKITGGELLLTCASSQYKNYKDVNSNYNPITQSTPIYTNVTNGLGIVCAVNELIYKTDLVLLTLDSIFVFVPEFKLKK